MRGVGLIVRRELSAYFNGIWGWAIVAAILVIDGLLFNAFAVGSKPRLSAEVLQDFFFFSFGTTIIASIFLTMRLIAEERQTGTIVLIDAAPLRDWQIVAGKYLSAYAVLAGLTLSTLYMPALIFVNGKVSGGHVFSGYLGLLLVGAATTAIGTFGSALARSQLVAGVLSSAMVVFFLVAWMLAKISEAPLADLFSYVSLFDRHFQPFLKGTVQVEGIVYYVGVAWCFLALSTRWLAIRRWR
jgi:ABC-2 type transport system permease protein